ncbi:MAG TPA: hypothetical protein GX503_00260 [Clostridiales bacterium]|nr:hypothetical protein [Clostridiales bacterium]
MEEQSMEQFSGTEDYQGFDYRNMLLPIALYTLFYRNGQGKLKTDEMVRTTQIVKSVKPYFKSKPREVLAKTESILEIFNALNRYLKGEYKIEKNSEFDAQSVSNKPVKILEAVRPHLKGEGKERIEKMLLLNDRINRLKNSSGGKRNLIEDAENITDILETLQHEKGREIRELINKTKEIMKIIYR